VRVAPAAGELRDRQSLWQITACDAACSQGVASLLPELSAAATATFLRQILVPLYRRAAWPLQRVLTDGRSEFKAAFAEACRALSIVVKPIARAPEHGDEPAVIKPFHPAAPQRESTTPVAERGQDSGVRSRRRAISAVADSKEEKARSYTQGGSDDEADAVCAWIGREWCAVETSAAYCS
jgi:hypothetical protein